MNQRGSLLMIVLWITAILGIFAIGLGHRAAVALKVARYQRDALHARLLAEAGLNQAIAILEEDEADLQTQGYDTLESCGVNLAGRQPQEVFSQSWQEQKQGFRIGYAKEGDFIYGVRDEKSRINLNPAAAGLSNFDKSNIAILLQLRGVNYPEELSQAIADWVNPASTNPLAKKEALAVPEELIFIFANFFEEKGFTPQRAAAQAAEVYGRIRDAFSARGAEEDDKININTAEEEILRVFCRAAAREESLGDDIGDSLAGAIIARRNSRPFLKEEEINLFSTSNSDQDRVFKRLRVYLVPRSDCFRIHSSAESNNILRNIVAVYGRKNNRICLFYDALSTK